MAYSEPEPNILVSSTTLFQVQLPHAMLEEELYNQALAELNSDRRNPKVWAEACALAVDDHDEARFLYSNIRVKQMMAESSADVLNELAAEPTSAEHEFHADDTAPKRKVNRQYNTEPPSSIDIDADSTLLEFTADNDAILSDLTDIQAEQHAGPMSIDDILELSDEEAAKIADTHANGIHINDLDSSVVYEINGSDNDLFEQNTSFEKKNASKLTQELNRQATELDTGESPNPRPKTAIALNITSTRRATHRQAPAQDDWMPSSQEHNETGEYNQTGEYSQTGEYEADDESMIQIDYAGTRDFLFDEIEDAPATTLNDGNGRPYMVFSRKGQIKAVKHGVSWPALFFTLPWLLSKQLLGTAVVYALLSAIALFGLIVSGLEWQQAGAAATTETKLWTAAFAVLVLIGQCYVPFKYGNQWVARKLLNRGFEFETLVSAKSRKAAIERLLKFVS